MPKHSSVPITLPARVKPGDNISAAWANSIREAVWRLTMRGTPDVIRPRGKGSKPNPFDVTLITIPAEGEGDPTYEVSVYDGYINEIILGVFDPPTSATETHKPFNILWGEDATEGKLATDRRTFPIAIGDQVSIVASVSAEGPIGGDDAPEEGPVEIVIEEEDEEDSICYIPPCADDETGSDGEIHYKLAVLRDADDTHSAPWLELFLAGSHIDYCGEFLIDNVSNPAPSGAGRVVKEYKADANKFLFRLIKEGGELTVTEEDDGIEVRGNEKDGNLIIGVEGESPQTVLTWTDGLVDQNGDTTVNIPSYDPPAGWWGTCTFSHFAEVGDTEPYLVLQQSFENGILVGVSVQEPAGELTPVTGTEGTPGAAEFASNGGNL